VATPEYVAEDLLKVKVGAFPFKISNVKLVVVVPQPVLLQVIVKLLSPGVRDPGIVRFPVD
jgi:hypothetical protein